MQEDTQKDGDSILCLDKADVEENIREAGEDVRIGEGVLKKGITLSPAHIGMLAVIGRSQIAVSQRPTVSILSTGDEILELDETPQGPQIFNSNGHMLAAQIKSAGGIPVYLGIAKDTEKDLMEKFEWALTGDIVVSSGGVSVGDYDLVKSSLQKMGQDMLFWKVAMKTGKTPGFRPHRQDPHFRTAGQSSVFIRFVRTVCTPVFEKGAGLFRPVPQNGASQTDTDYQQETGPPAFSQFHSVLGRWRVYRHPGGRTRFRYFKICRQRQWSADLSAGSRRNQTRAGSGCPTAGIRRSYETFTQLFIQNLSSSLFLMAPGNVLAQSSASLDRLVSQIESMFPPLEGYVIAVDGSGLTLDIRQGMAVNKGDRLKLIRYGRELFHPVTKKKVGRKETDLGEVEVLEVRKDYSLARALNPTVLPKEGDGVRSAFQKLSFLVAPPQVKSKKKINIDRLRYNLESRINRHPRFEVPTFDLALWMIDEKLNIKSALQSKNLKRLLRKVQADFILVPSVRT